MEAKENLSIANLEIKSINDSIKFYTPQYNTLYPIWFCWVVKKGTLVSGWNFSYTRDIEVGKTKVIGFTTGVYTYIDNEKYLEIELTPGTIPTKYNNASLGHKVRTRAINKFYEDGRRSDQVMLMDIPATCFVKESDVNIISQNGLLYDFVDQLPIIDKHLTDIVITDTLAADFSQKTTDTKKDTNNSKSNKSLLLALGILALKYL